MLAELSGFSDPKYLTKAFKEKFGYPLKEHLTMPHSDTSDTNNKAPCALQRYLTAKEVALVLNK